MKRLASWHALSHGAVVYFIRKPFSIRGQAIKMREALEDWRRSI